MFQSMMALDLTLHRNLGLLPGTGYGFSKTTMTAPLAASEIVNAARLYPLVFPVQGYTPQALMSLEPGVNLFVGENGNWLADYIPAHFRRWPFMLQGTDPNVPATVIFDTAAPTLKDGEGQRLFDEDGQVSAFFKPLLQFLVDLNAEAASTEVLLSALEPILIEQHLEVRINGEMMHRLNGFRVIDTEKFAALPDATVLEWRANGLLSVVYAHLISMGNVNRLATLHSERNKR